MSQIIKASEINEKFEEVLDFPMVGEAIDLFLLQNYVKPNYQPSVEPWVMDVGALGVKTARVAKHFHLEEFGIPYSKTTVVGINTRPIHPEYRYIMDIYDIVQSGPMEGNALNEFTWAAPFMKNSGAERLGYDLTIIRNPDLVNIQNWEGVFMRALEYTRGQGSVVTIIREGDVQKYERLLSGLKNNFGVKPIISEQTKVENDLMPVNHQHTIGVFKPLTDR